MGEGYVVVVKASARRVNAGAGEWVHAHGSMRTFESKVAARAWATSLTDSGGAVRVQDAVPHDPAPVDGYLVADPGRDRSSASTDASVDGPMTDF